jgi:hypothetical protein
MFGLCLVVAEILVPAKNMTCGCAGGQSVSVCLYVAEIVVEAKNMTCGCAGGQFILVCLYVAEVLLQPGTWPVALYVPVLQKLWACSHVRNIKHIDTYNHNTIYNMIPLSYRIFLRTNKRCKWENRSH